VPRSPLLLRLLRSPLSPPMLLSHLLVFLDGLLVVLSRLLAPQSGPLSGPLTSHRGLPTSPHGPLTSPPDHCPRLLPAP
jgi:hypothetical protein